MSSSGRERVPPQLAHMVVTHHQNEQRSFLLALSLVFFLTCLPPQMLFFFTMMMLLCLPFLRFYVLRTALEREQRRAEVMETLNAATLRYITQAETPEERQRRINRLRGAFHDAGISERHLEVMLALDRVAQLMETRSQESQLEFNTMIADEIIANLNRSPWKGEASNHDENEEEEEEEGACCIICLDEFSDGDDVATLRCGHYFHAACIERWIRNEGARATCPMCKSVLSERIQTLLNDANTAPLPEGTPEAHVVNSLRSVHPSTPPPPPPATITEDPPLSPPPAAPTTEGHDNRTTGGVGRWFGGLWGNRVDLSHRQVDHEARPASNVDPEVGLGGGEGEGPSHTQQRSGRNNSRHSYSRVDDGHRNQGRAGRTAGRPIDLEEGGGLLED